jgi:hypothetical protein
MSALGSTLRGVAASAPGTLAMDASLGKDLSAHLVFGTATAAAFSLLADQRVDK